MALFEKVIPVAEKVFTSKPVKNSSIGKYDIECSSRFSFDRIIAKSLMLFDGRHIRHYLDEYPFCVYCCKKEACPNMAPNFFLNSYIKEIVLSVVDAGREYFLGSTSKLDAEDIGKDTVAYYKDNKDEIHLIKDEEIFKFLFKRPDLVVTSEGMLVFYAENTILVTFDMKNYHWIKPTDFLSNEWEISGVVMEDRKCFITVRSDKKVRKYQLMFSFDFTKSNPINYGILFIKIFFYNT